MIPIETVSTNGIAMRYFKFGTGEKTMVILPGLSIQSVMGAADAVADAYRSLEDTFTIWLFDRRENLPPVYSVHDMARDTAAVMKALGLHDVYLFGASQGGMMALVIAIEYPELVKKVVLGSTSARVTEDRNPVIDHWLRLAREEGGRALYLAFGEAIYPTAVFEQYRDALAAAGDAVTDEDLRRFLILAEGIRGFDVSDRLDRIRCPVLAIGVFEDAVLDSDATMEIAEKLDERPDFRLYMYIGYGHAAFDTAPDYHDRMFRFFME